MKIRITSLNGLKMLALTLLLVCSVDVFAQSQADGKAYKRNIITPQNYETATSLDDWANNEHKSVGYLITKDRPNTGDGEYVYGAPYYAFAIINTPPAYKPLALLQDAGSGYVDSSVKEKGYNVEFDFQMFSGVLPNELSKLIVACNGNKDSSNDQNYIFSLSQQRANTYQWNLIWHVGDTSNQNVDTVHLDKAWYHVKIAVTNNKATYTISYNNNIIENGSGELNLNGIPSPSSIIMQNHGGYLYFDNFEAYDYVTERQPTTPTIKLVEKQARSRKYSISFSNGDELYYQLPGEETYTKYTGNGNSVDVTITQDGTLSAYTVYGPSRSASASEVVSLSPATIEIGSEVEMASFSSAYPVRVPNDVYIYYANMNNAISPDYTTVTVSRIKGSNVIPANQGVFLYKKGGGMVSLDYDDVSGTDASSYTGNVLTGTCDGTFTVQNENEIYGLSKHLYQGKRYIASIASGAVIGPNKAYANFAALMSQLGGARLNIAFDDETTGINFINIDDTRMINNIYNLNGQQVGKSYKGIVIKDGKKYINK